MKEDFSAAEMEQSPKKKHATWRVLTVLLLAAAAFAIYWVVQKYQKTWNGNIETVFPFDLNHDGQDDTLLMVINSHESKAAIKAMELQSGNIRWKKQAELNLNDWRSSNIGYVNDLLVMPQSSKEDGMTSLEALDAKTGELRWTYPLGATGFPYRSQVLIHNNHLYAMIKSHNVDPNRFISIDAVSGKEKWRIDLDNHSLAPIFFNNQAVVASHDDTVLIDLSSGAKHALGERVKPFAVGDELIALNRTSGSVGRWQGDNANPAQILSPIEIKNHTNFTWTPSVAIHDGRIIFCTDPHNTADNIIEAIPYQTQKTGFRYELKDGFGVRGDFYRDWEKLAYERSAFHVIEGRYVPLYLRKKTGENTEDVKVAIFDLVEGKPSWESKVNREDPILHLESDIVRLGKNYVIFFPLGSKYQENSVLMILDGSSGSFVGVKELRYLEVNALKYYNIQTKPEHFQSGHYYGFYNDTVWAFDLDKLKLSFASSDKIQVVDAKAKVEERLGKLP